MSPKRRGKKSSDRPPSAARTIVLLENLQAAAAGIDGSGDLKAAHVQQICDGLVDLASAARLAGLSTFCSLTLHSLEQLRPVIHTNFASIRLIGVFRDWIDSSLKYLRNPCCSLSAHELIATLGDRRWERPVDKAHREALLGGLRQEGTIVGKRRSQPVATQTRGSRARGESLALR